MRNRIIIFLGLVFADSLFAADYVVTIPLQYSGDSARAVTFTWTVTSGGGAPRSGQYADGSLWFAPAVGQTAISIDSLAATSDGIAQASGLVTLDADPVPGLRGLLNNAKAYGDYSAAQNIADDLPEPFTPTSTPLSLVAALQRNEAQNPGGGAASIRGESTDAYCVVTLLDAPPAGNGADMLRPNITGETKETLSWSDFDLTRLGANAAYPTISSTNLENIRVRWSHSVEIFGLAVEGVTYSEGGRAFRATAMHDEYAAGMNQQLQTDILGLFNTGNTLAQKKPALAAILVWANDIYHARYDYGANPATQWTSGAGQHVGKLAPVYMLAALLINTTKADVVRMIAVNNQAPDSTLRGPQELRQIRRGVTGVVLWGDAFPYIYASTTSYPGGETRRYWTDLVAAQQFRGATPYGNSNTGQKTAGDPYGYIDGPANEPGGFYMPIGTAATKGLAAVMILMPSVRDLVGTDAPIEYADRVTRIGTWAAPDPIAPPPWPATTDNVWSGTFPGTDLGVTFGPQPADVRFGIEDGSGIGRFVAADWHGQAISTSYASSLVGGSYWPSIIATYTGETYEDNVVAVTATAKPDIIVVGTSAYFTHPHPLAVVRYTTNGTNPTGASAIATSPISVSGVTDLRLMAQVSGKTDSAVRTWTASGASAPTAPSSLSALAFISTQINLTWLDNSSDETGFEIERSLDGSTGWANITTTAANATSFPDAPLSPLTQYFYRVRAVNGAGGSSYTATANATTQPVPTPPPARANVRRMNFGF